MTQRLNYGVECKSSLPFFERIAAFDCEWAAKMYADDCATTSPHNEYRVVKNKRVLQYDSGVS